MKYLQCLCGLLLLGLLTLNSHAGTLVQFQIFLGAPNYLGEVDVEMYDQDKPATVKNFLRLIQAGAYNDSIFHRLVPGFVLQGGSYGCFSPFSTNLVAPPFPLLFTIENFGNVTNEFKTGKFYSNTNWTIAMAKTSDPNSANSGFFFNLANNASSLDDTNNSGGFTVFGHVVSGTNVLNFFNSLFYGNGLVNLTNNYGPSGFFTQLPDDLANSNPPSYELLDYFNVSVVTPQIKIATNGARQISWNMVAGHTNNLEFTTNLPANWQVLTSTNNVNGGVATVSDSNTNKTRFYRIHVLF